MTTLDRVRALFPEGAIVTTIENTYRPILNGTRRRIDEAAKSYCTVTMLDGAKAGQGNFRMPLPTRAADVLELADGRVTYRLGGPAGPDDTVTFQVTERGQA